MRFLIFSFAVLLFLAPSGQKSTQNLQPKTAEKQTDSGNQFFECDSVFLKYYTQLLNTSSQLNVNARFPGDPAAEIKKRFLSAVYLRKKHEYKQAYSLLMQDALTGVNSVLFYSELARTAAAAQTTADCLLLLRRSGGSLPFVPFTQAVILSLAGLHNKAIDTLSAGYSFLYARSPLYYLFIAEVTRRSGNYSGAQKYLDSAFAKSKQIFGADTPPVLICKFSGEQANINWYNGNKTEAAKFYSQRLAVAKKYVLPAEKAYALTGLGITLDDNNNTGKARLAFDEALNIARQLGEDDLLAYCLMESGAGYTIAGDYPSAVKQYKESYDIYRKTGNRARLALLADNMGRHYFSLGALREAKESFLAGLDYDEASPRSAALHSQGLGDVYSACGNYTAALTWYTKAKAYAEEVNDYRIIAETDYGIGVMCYYAGNLSVAQRQWRSVITLYDKHKDDLLTGLAWQGLAALMPEGDSLTVAESFYTVAAGYFASAGDKTPALFGTIDLARAYTAAGKTERAKQLLATVSVNRANPYAHKLEPLFLIASAEAALAAGNAAVALRTAGDAITITRRNNDHDLNAEVYDILAEASAMQGNSAQAQSYFLAAIAEKENIEQVLFPEQNLQVLYNERQHSVYEKYISFLIEHALYEEAFLIIERERSRSTFQKLMTMRLNDTGQFSRLLEQTLEARWLVTSSLVVQKDIDSLRNFIASTQQQLLAAYPELVSLLDPAKITLQGLASSLPSNMAYIQVYSGDKQLVLFALKNGKLFTHTLQWDAQDIEEKLSSVSPYYYPGKENAPLTADLFAFNAGAAHQLYKDMCEPLLAKTGQAERLLFSVPGKLAGFPFELLVTGGTLTSDYRYDDKQFLSDNYTISYIPSLKLYAELLRRDDVFQGEYMAIGDPVLSGKENGFALHRGLLDELPGAQRGIALLPLKYSAEELDELSGLLPSVRVFSKEEATEDNFRKYASAAKLIHISTHSALLQNLPVIFFASSGNEAGDGTLEPAEVAGMQLKADLVTLSSCQSGSGLATIAEGITGMSKAFFEGGAKSVVVSLWQVNDRYTASFMKFFYEALSEGNDKAVALQQAKMRFRKEVNANPYYWGAFILAGKTSPLLQVSGIERYRSLFALCFVLLLGSVTGMWYFTGKKRVIVSSSNGKA